MKPKDFHLKFPQWQNGNWIIGLGSYLFTIQILFTFTAIIVEKRN